MLSTNYYDTFIEIAEDCKAVEGTPPPQRGTKKSVANYEYELLANNPYRFTSDDVIFQIFSQRNDIAVSEEVAQRELYFSKGRPCFRASPLTKSYGWGVHSNAKGKIAIFGVESEEYQAFVNNPDIQKKKAMRSKRAK